MRDTVKKLLWISRPISWPNTAYPFAAAYLVAGGQFDATFVLGTLYFLIPYNLMMYGVNDVFDYESDIRNPRKGGVEGMREQRAFHPTILRAVLLTNVPLIAYLLAVGDGVSRLILAGVVGLALAYSLPKLRFKERPVLDSLTSSLHFVGPMVYGFSLTAWPENWLPYTCAFIAWGMASHAFGAVQDIIPDRQGKIHSVATFLGARATVWLAFVLYIVAATIVAAQGGMAILVGIFGCFYALNIMPYLQVTDQTSSTSNAAWRRFLWLNYAMGAAITIVLLSQTVGLLA